MKHSPELLIEDDPLCATPTVPFYPHQRTTIDTFRPPPPFSATKSTNACLFIITIKLKPDNKLDKVSIPVHTTLPSVCPVQQPLHYCLFFSLVFMLLYFKKQERLFLYSLCNQTKHHSPRSPYLLRVNLMIQNSMKCSAILQGPF